MKKIFSITIAAATPFLVNAQNNHTPYIDKDIFNVCASIAATGLFMAFILYLLKRTMDYRLKSKIIEKGISEGLASSILQTNLNENKNAAIKWVAILTAIAVAFTIIYYTLPLGMHSLAIMGFCLAAGFLGYYIFLTRSSK